MNRLELYIDKNDRLTLDFYINQNDEYPMAVFKGEKCYGLISQLCQSPILDIKENPKMEQVSLSFKETILNINGYEELLAKRGTGPIKKSLSRYYETEKQKTFKPKKVKRVNKHINVEIIAGVLALSVLGAMLVNQYSKQKQPDNLNPVPTTTVYETEPTTVDIENVFVEEEIPETTIAAILEEQDAINQDDKISAVDESNFEDNSVNVCISYEDRSDQEKGKITKAYYGDVIDKCAKTYGLDSNIVLAIATQERGIHSEKKDPGGATGLMQIQNAVWVGENITAYNYDLGKYETILVKEESLSDVFYNIKIGCMYFQNCMDYMNNNVLAAIQCYNYGYGNMQTVLNNYSFDSGKTKKAILEDISDCGWMDYRTAISKNEGDSIYIEHVLSWLGSKVNISNEKLKSMPVNLTITNSNFAKIK